MDKHKLLEHTTHIGIMVQLATMLITMFVLRVNSRVEPTELPQNEDSKFYSHSHF